MGLKTPLRKSAWHSRRIEDTEGQYVARTETDSEADELIRRVNLHEPLVDILKLLLPHAARVLEGTGTGEELLQRAKTLLNRAGVLTADEEVRRELLRRYEFRSVKPPLLDRTQIYREGVYCGHFEPYWTFDPDKKWTGIAVLEPGKTVRFFAPTAEKIKERLINALEAHRITTIHAA